MRKLGRALIPALVGAVTLAFCLGGCEPAQSGDSGPGEAIEPTPTPSSTAIVVSPLPGLAVVPGDELFTFVGAATTEYGAKLDITMTLHRPVEWDSPSGSTIIQYLNSQHIATSLTDPTWNTANSASLGVIDVSAIATGDPWRTGSEIELLLGPFLTKDVTVGLPGKDLNGHFALSGAGVGHAIVAFPAFDGGPDALSWAESSQIYGLVPVADSSTNDELRATAQNCSMALTEEGLLNEWVANWFMPTADSCSAGIGD
jgi:hypothetical protein